MIVAASTTKLLDWYMATQDLSTKISHWNTTLSAYDRFFFVKKKIFTSISIIIVPEFEVSTHNSLD